jgi:hypothetical protein
VFRKKINKNQSIDYSQAALSNATFIMIAILTSLSILLVALIANIISVAEFGKALGFSDSKIAALNLVILRIKELNFGIVAVFIKAIHSFF